MHAIFNQRCWIGLWAATVFVHVGLVQICVGQISGGVSFDVPAIAQARILSTSHVVTVKKPVANLILPMPSPAKSNGPITIEIDADEYQPHTTPEEMLVEIVMPVSSVLEPKLREQIREFRFDVFWNRAAYPLVDYGPRTVTTSSIAGTVAKESSKNRERQSGLNLSGGFEPLDNASLSAELSNRQSDSARYQEIPQHDVLVASGSVRRGTGAFFRFHPSRQETLEGGRELVVVFRVPHSWRAGALQVECRGVGSRKVLGLWHEPVEASRAFIVPVFLKGDDQARHLAEDYVRQEQGLKSSWNQYLQRRKQTAEKRWPIRQTFSGQPSEVAANWVHYLIQTGGETSLDRVRRQLPGEIQAEAGEFLEARRELLKLSRCKPKNQ